MSPSVSTVQPERVSAGVPLSPLIGNVRSQEGPISANFKEMAEHRIRISAGRKGLHYTSLASGNLSFKNIPTGPLPLLPLVDCHCLSGLLLASVYFLSHRISRLMLPLIDFHCWNFVEPTLWWLTIQMVQIYHKWSAFLLLAVQLG